MALVWQAGSQPVLVLVARSPPSGPNQLVIPQDRAHRELPQRARRGRARHQESFRHARRGRAARQESFRRARQDRAAHQKSFSTHESSSAPRVRFDAFDGVERRTRSRSRHAREIEQRTIVNALDKIDSAPGVPSTRSTERAAHRESLRRARRHRSAHQESFSTRPTSRAARQ